MNIVSSPSPNANQRPAGVEPDMLVIHGTVGNDAGDLSWLTNDESDVSYHYLIQRDGTVHHLVPDTDRAWHAGKSSWEGRDDCNDYSIGIGLSNLGNGEPYTEEQYDACKELVAILRERWAIPWDRVVGHCHIAPGRKTDPWLYFRWTRLF